MLPDDRAARVEAVRLLGELLTDEPEHLLETGVYAIVVSDERQVTLFLVETGLVEASAV